MSSDQLSQELLKRVTAKAEDTIRDVISAALSEEINRALTRALTEGEFYRSISTDLQDGLRNIYQEINAAASNETGLVSVESSEADEMFSEASRQLREILQTTEKATENIMTVVEKHLEQTEQNLVVLDKLEPSPAVDQLRANAQTLNTDLIEIMTALSFQDLTGQRIKRIVTALQQIEKVVFELYMSTGLSLKAMAEHPEKSVDEIRETSRARASELKGPQSAASQTDVDDLLSQLGL
ncbi:MAG: protein phosphatase CheZ [Desulfovibrionales bacterium]|nr:protein phosphatase CheZ [Desulfovibrionales bacterium]